MRPIFTLTTDFGDSPYVGQMKAVLVHRVPECRIVDVTHAIRAQDVVMGAIALADSIPFFPNGSIHIAVVDPGVGTNRPIVVAHIGTWYFIGPDNGLFSEVAKDWPIHDLVRVQDFSAVPEISSTFHGRDVMAPIAAKLALGERLEMLGDRAHALHPSLIPEPLITAQSIRGRVITRDSFGNLITNIKMKHGVLNRQLPKIQLPNRTECVKWVRTYGESEPGTVVALAGSSGRIELSIVNGDASKVLSERDTEIEISW